MTTTPPAPTVTTFTNAAPCPRVEIVITPMPGDADSIVIYRSWSGQRTAVRGASSAEVAGDFLILDYEVPLGVAVTYSCVTYNTGGTPSQESASTTVTVTVSEVWLQDPLDPTGAIRAGLSTQGAVMVVAPSFLPAVYATTSEVMGIVGSRLPVGAAGTRRAASRVPLTLLATTVSDAAAVQELLEQAFPLCVRTPAVVRQLGGLTYLAIPDFEPQPQSSVVTSFSMTGDSVRGPGAGIVVQPRTYDDLLDEAATYADLLVLYPTYLDLQRGP